MKEILEKKYETNSKNKINIPTLDNELVSIFERNGSYSALILQSEENLDSLFEEDNDEFLEEYRAFSIGTIPNDITIPAEFNNNITSLSVIDNDFYLLLDFYFDQIKKDLSHEDIDLSFNICEGF